MWPADWKLWSKKGVVATTDYWSSLLLPKLPFPWVGMYMAGKGDNVNIIIPWSDFTQISFFPCFPYGEIIQKKFTFLTDMFPAVVPLFKGLCFPMCPPLLLLSLPSHCYQGRALFPLVALLVPIAIDLFTQVYPDGDSNPIVATLFTLMNELLRNKSCIWLDQADQDKVISAWLYIFKHLKHYPYLTLNRFTAYLSM